MTDPTDAPQPSARTRMLAVIFGILFPIIIVVFGITVVFPAIVDEMRPTCDGLKPISTIDVPIYSTIDGTAIEGSFFLGCGHVNTKMVYYLYVGDDVNGFERKMIDADNVVVYRDSEVPHMITKRVYKMIPIPPTEICGPVEIIELHVPKNTLIKDV